MTNRNWLLAAAMASAGLLAACNNSGGDAEEAEAPEATDVALADACPERVTDMRGSNDPLNCSCTVEAAADGNVWGAGPYTDDSNVCRAAMHAGLLTDEPVNVTINFMAGRRTYSGTTAHGVTSRRYGNWDGSFAFEGAAMGEEISTSGLEPCPDIATALRDADGPLACSCSAQAASDSRYVWGSGPYTDDSGICVAAVHAGVIGRDGGDVSLSHSAGLDSYSGSTANNVTTRDYGNYGGSFDFNEDAKG